MTIAPAMRIFPIDDDPAGAELTMAALKMLDAKVQVGVAADGEEALDYLLRLSPYATRGPVEAPWFAWSPWKGTKVRSRGCGPCWRPSRWPVS